MNSITVQLAEALRACVAREGDSLALAADAIDAFEACQAWTDRATPQVPDGDRCVANASNTRFASFGPRHNGEPCPAREATAWSVYEWSADEGPHGEWLWCADCANDSYAELLAQAMTQGA